jgi:hypothetical protein
MVRGAENNKPPQTRGVGWCTAILDGSRFVYFDGQAASLAQWADMGQDSLVWPLCGPRKDVLWAQQWRTRRIKLLLQ